MAPNLVGLRSSAPLPVVMVSHARLKDLSELGAILHISWASQWVASDPTSLFYDGIRLGRGGQHGMPLGIIRIVFALCHPITPSLHLSTSLSLSPLNPRLLSQC